MITVTKRVGWDMAHRLGADYPGPCASVHGHHYIAEMTFACGEVDKRGMIIDFTDVKKYCKGWIDGHLDHRTMVDCLDDPLLDFLEESSNAFVKVPFCPTVENMTPWMAYELDGALRGDDFDDRRVQLTALRVYETPDSWCDWRRDE